MTDRRVAYMRITDIEPATRNPKKHATDAIAKSVDRYGLAELPLLDERTGRLVAGHGRLDDLIARRRHTEDPPDGIRLDTDGEWLVPVIRGWSSTSDADAEAYLVASNRLTTLGGWNDEELAGMLGDLQQADADLLAVTGYTDDDITALLAADDVDPVRIELPDAGSGGSGGGSSSVKPEPLTKPGDLYALGPHRVLCGDATNPDHVDQLLEALDGLPTLVVTDPPYGINAVGKDGKVGDARGSKGSPTLAGGGGKFVATRQSEPIAGDDTTDAASDAFRFLQTLLPEAVQVWWGANHYAASAGIPDAPGWLVWDKQTNGDFADAELAWTNYGGAVRRLVHLWNGLARATEKSAPRVHPTQKPVALFDWVFEIVDRRNERKIVLDVFAGSGPVLLAAESSGRTCAAMELAPAYVDVICRRWQELTGRKPERILDTGAREPVDFTT